jgi:hypothetical protein
MRKQEANISTKDSINNREIALFGLKRSGNHAFIYWLMEQLGRGTVHLNDVNTEDPFESCREINIRGLPSFCKKKGAPSITTRWRTIEYSKNRLDVDWAAIRSHSPKTGLILSYENRSLDTEIYTKFCHRHDEMVGKSDQRFHVVLLRDAFNLFASQYRASFIQSADIEEGIRIYKQYAELFLNPEKQIERKTICVNYNQWFQDSRYRIELGKQFGLDINGKAYRAVPSIGGGSSFEGTSRQGNGHRMDVLQRWKRLSDDPGYQKIFTDKYLVELTNEIFGPIAPQFT